MRKHTIPVHLETQDTLLYGLTTRQLLVLALGLAVAYSLWSDWGMLSFPLAVAVCVGAVAVAFVKPQQQSLDTWLLIWLFFVCTTKTLLWEPLAELPEPPVKSQQIDTQKEDGDE